MAYISLYRKYRPQTFADTDLVGQGHITHTLQHAIAAGRVAHAYLFCGPRGTGKTTTARLLAKALNCDRGPTPEPCDQCPACEAIKNGSALDVIEIDAASNRGIDQIRDLRDRVAFAPAEGRYKVYIIDEVHMLTNESFNALLKTLEEPPAHVVFVMATTEAHRLPPTILSRCQRFDFHRIPAADMLARLQLICQAEGIEADEQALSLLVRAAEGCMRDALSLLEQAYAYATGAVGPDEVHAVLGGVDTGLLLDFGRVISQHDAAAAFRLVEQTVSQGKDVRAVVGELVDHFRNLLLLATVRDGDGLVALPPAAVKQLAAQAAEIPPETLLRALETFSEAERELRWSTQQRLVLELALVKLCRPAPAPAAAVQPAAPAARAAARRPAPSPVGQEPAPAPAATSPAAPPVGQELAPAPAQEPAPAPPAGQAAAPAVDGDPLAQVKEHWPAILMRFRKTGRVQISAFLTEADPVAITGNALQLHFRQSFHCDAMSKRTAELEEVLREFGLSLTVKCAMAPGLAEQAAPPKPSVISRNVMGVFPGSTEIEG